MLTDADRVPLASRALISDGATGALVAADGTIDWYCPGRIDAAPALARLLDPDAGAVRVGPVRPGPTARRRLPAGRQSYRDDSLVLETEIGAGGSRLLLTDFMPWAGPGSTPPGRIVRVATALAGPVDVEVEVIPGGAWGPARAVSGWSEGLVADRTVVHAGFPLVSEPLDRYHPRWRGVRRLDAGESLVVTVDDGPLGRHPALSVEGALRAADETATAWRSWLGPLVYDGSYGPAVRRAALTVRSLTSAFGGPVAAATTSLPRRVGGERGADDRIVRLADAATAAGTLAAIGFPEDAEAAEHWLRVAVEASPSPWPVALDLEGGPAPERDERPLPGWRRSQPVVTGVVAGLVDHDIYGDVASSVSISRSGPWGAGGDGPLVGAWPALVAGADWLTDHWQQPDAGRWGSEGRPARLVASAVQAWVALEAMRHRAQSANPLDLAVVPWHRAARDILAWLQTDGLGDDDGLRRDPVPGDRRRRRPVAGGVAGPVAGVAPHRRPHRGPHHRAPGERAAPLPPARGGRRRPARRRQPRSPRLSLGRPGPGSPGALGGRPRSDGEHPRSGRRTGSALRGGRPHVGRAARQPALERHPSRRHRRRPGPRRRASVISGPILAWQ